MKNVIFRMRVLYLLFILCSMSSVLYAKTIYVAPEGKAYSGSNTSSSYNEPIKFSSIFANTSSMPTSFLLGGDTIYFKGGQYDLDKTIALVQSGSNGTSDKRTVLKACAGEIPVFDFRSLPYGSEITGKSNNGFTMPASFVDIIGLRVCYAGKNGMLVTGSNNLIENCAFYGNGDSGLQLKGGGNNLIKNCDSYMNFDYKLIKNDVPNYGENADGFADKQYTSPSGMANTYIGCRSWDNSDDGWDFYQRISSTAPSVLQDCWCFRTGPAEYDMTNHPRYETDKDFLDQFKTEDGRIIVPNYGNGNAFKIGGDFTNHYVKLVNCIAVDSKASGFDQNSDAGHMIIYNCLASGNSRNYSLGRKVEGATLDIKNCISFQNKGSDTFQVGADISDTQQSNNTWNFGLVPSVGDFESVDVSRIIDPRNSDGSLPDMGGLFRLSSPSRLIDRGLDIGLPYCHNAPDLGAFEYCGEIGKEDAVFLLVNENFQSWSPLNSSVTETKITKMTDFSNETLIYKLKEVHVDPTDSKMDKTRFNYSVVSTGNLMAAKMATPYIELSPLASITHVEFIHAATGSNRGFKLSKKVGDGEWEVVSDSYANPSSGTVVWAEVNAENVSLKFENLNPEQNAYLFDLKIYGHVAGLGINDAGKSIFDLYVSGGGVICSEDVSITIFSLSGMPIKSEANTRRIFLQSLDRGIYILKAVNAGGEKITRKILR